jgi:hypothetical protein
MAQERRLCQDFSVQERRLGLEGDGQELFESMDPAGRVHIVERDCKENSPEKPCDEVRKTTSGRFGAPSDDVITFVNRREQGPQVIRAIGLGGGCDQNQR